MTRVILKTIWPFVRHIKKIRAVYLPLWYERQLLSLYSKEEAEAELSGIIVMQDQFFTSGGLVDRIKGIVSGYWLASELKLSFHVYVKDLKDPIRSILQSKNINVIDDKSKLSFSKLYAAPVVWYNKKPREWSIVREKVLKRKQVHLYCNMDLLSLMNDNYSVRTKAWSEAFKGIFDINNFGYVDNQFENGNGVIGIHLRFIGLLGDFKDLRNNSLTEAEKKEMKDWCKNQILRIYNKYDSPVLLVADSPDFLTEFKAEMEQEYKVHKFIIESTAIGHTALDESEHVFKKTIIDFNLLSKCRKVYQLRYGKMHNSDFSRYAAMVNLNDFELVENDLSK